MAPSELEKNIVKTVAWFSLFDYPLTAFEIWKWLGLKCFLPEVETTLRESVWLRGRLAFQDGLFVLGGRPAEVAVALHQERFLDAARKFKKLNRAASFFSLFPFVRAVFACNNLAWHNTAPKSDIDLFVVVSPGTIWLSRLLLVIPFVFLKKRPPNALMSKKASPLVKTQDPFCFSFFVTSDRLSLEKLFLSDGDPYMPYWLASLVPVFDRDGIQNKIFEKNKRVFGFSPNVFLTSSNNRKKFLLPLGFLKIFEPLARSLQKKFFPRPIKAAANLDTRVIISDSVLKFHLNDRRAWFRDEWKKLYEAYGAK